MKLERQESKTGYSKELLQEQQRTSSLAVYRESLRAKRIKRSVQLLQGVRLNMKGKNI